MELTPHIKELFDDLITLTKCCVVKRPDTAMQKDDEVDQFNLEMFYAYRDIVNGVDSISSYSTIPEEVLKDLVGWAVMDDRSILKKILPGSGSIHNEITEADQYYHFRAPTASDQLPAGTLWVHKIGKEAYTRLYTESGSSTVSGFSFNVGTDAYDNEIPEGIFTVDGVRCMPYFNEEYILTDDDRDTHDTYGNPYNYSNTTYQHDELTDTYFESTDNSVDLYVRRYSYGYYYIEPIAGNEIWTTSDDLSEQSHQIISGPYVEIESVKTLVSELSDEQMEALTGEETVYYRVVEVTRNVPDDATVYAFNGEECYFNIGNVSNSVNVMYYFTEDENGDYILDENEEYVKDFSTTHKGFRYKKVEAEEGIDRYTYSGGIYTPSATGTYTYVCHDYICYIAESVADIVGKNEITVISELDPQYWEAARVQMRQYVTSNYCPEVDPAEHEVPLYTGEASAYYRKLNGLPPIGDPTVPKVDRYLINPTYVGTNPNPYVWELTDAEIETLTTNGTLATLKENYPKAEYLDYLGKNRIDVIKARDARPFDILRMGDIENQYHLDMFMEMYAKSRDYVLGRFYQPEIFQEFTHYVSYLGFLIMGNAVMSCISHSDDILVYDGYMDDKTINMILDSYGFEGKFSSLPTIYRKLIAKNIMMLIKYRGTDMIYEIIYNICGVTNYDIFTYDITNNEGVLDVIRKSVLGKGETTVSSFNEMIEDDELWKAGADVISGLNFFKSGTKYLDFETIFDLSELALNNSFLLNYLMDVSKNKDIKIDVPGVGIYQLFDLIVALFAVQAIKFGYTGHIPTTPAASAAIYKFNIDQTIDGDKTVRSILDTYATRLTGDSLANINKLKEMINKSGSIVLPTNSETTIRSIADAYFKTIQKDSPNTNLNENSFYMEVIKLRDSTKNIDEYNCCCELLDCITTAYITRDNFTLDKPIWEPIFAGTYTGDLESYNKNNYTASKWAYGEDLSEVYPGIIDTSNYEPNVVNEVTLDDGVMLYTGNISPGLIDDMTSSLEDNYFMKVDQTNEVGVYSITLYQKCYHALTYSMYVREQCPDLYNKIYEVTVDDTYVIDIYDTVFSVTAPFIRVTKEGGVLTIDFGDSSNYTLHDHDGDGDIDLIALRDAKVLTYTEYYQILERNADNLFKKIISTIESAINANQLRENLIMSHESAENIVEYLKLLINTFKSYNTDIRNNKIVYRIDDKTHNSVRLFDMVYFDIDFEKRDELGLYDRYEITIDGGN